MCRSLSRFSVATSSSISRFRPYDLDANRYLAMKTQDIPGKVPTLDEVRGEVVRAWKLREAGKLALKRAEELAKKAQDAGGSLTDAIAGDESLKIVKTDPFAFFTIGNVSRDTQQVQSFRLSEPDGIVAAGPEFMEKVFALKEGEVAAAPNHDHSIAYVAKIAEHQNTLRRAAAGLSRGRLQLVRRARDGPRALHLGPQRRDLRHAQIGRRRLGPRPRPGHSCGDRIGRRSDCRRSARRENSGRQNVDRSTLPLRLEHQPRRDR